VEIKPKSQKKSIKKPPKKSHLGGDIEGGFETVYKIVAK
jgi:hypothetical protein